MSYPTTKIKICGIEINANSHWVDWVWHLANSKPHDKLSSGQIRYRNYGQTIHVANCACQDCAHIRKTDDLQNQYRISMGFPI